MRPLHIIAAASLALLAPAVQAQTATIEDWDKAARMCEGLIRDQDSAPLERLASAETPPGDASAIVEHAVQFPHSPLIISWSHLEYSGHIYRDSEGRAFGICTVHAAGVSPEQAVAIMGEWMTLQNQLTESEEYAGVTGPDPSIIGPMRVSCGNPGFMTVTMGIAQYGDPFFKVGVTRKLPEEIASPCTPAS